jgi:hypothetical protein
VRRCHGARIPDLAIGSSPATVAVTDSVISAREKLWHRGGDVVRYEAQGILILSEAQPKIKQPIRDIAVVSLFYARVVMGVLPTALVDPLFPRYADTMG